MPSVPSRCPYGTSPRPRVSRRQARPEIKLPLYLLARLREQAWNTAWRVLNGEITPGEAAVLGRRQAEAAYWRVWCVS